MHLHIIIKIILMYFVIYIFSDLLGGRKLVLGVDGTNDWTNLFCVVDLAICTISSNQSRFETLWPFHVK